MVKFNSSKVSCVLYGTFPDKSRIKAHSFPSYRIVVPIVRFYFLGKPSHGIAGKILNFRWIKSINFKLHFRPLESSCILEFSHSSIPVIILNALRLTSITLCWNLIEPYVGDRLRWLNRWTQQPKPFPRFLEEPNRWIEPPLEFAVTTYRHLSTFYHVRTIFIEE